MTTAITVALWKQRIFFVVKKKTYLSFPFLRLFGDQNVNKLNYEKLIKLSLLNYISFPGIGSAHDVEWIIKYPKPFSSPSLLGLIFLLLLRSECKNFQMFLIKFWLSSIFFPLHKFWLFRLLHFVRGTFFPDATCGSLSFTSGSAWVNIGGEVFFFFHVIWSKILVRGVFFWVIFYTEILVFYLKFFACVSLCWCINKR